MGDTQTLSQRADALEEEMSRELAQSVTIDEIVFQSADARFTCSPAGAGTSG